MDGGPTEICLTERYLIERYLIDKARSLSISLPLFYHIPGCCLSLFYVPYAP